MEFGVIEFIFDFRNCHFDNFFVLVDISESIAIDELDFGGDMVDGVVDIAYFFDRPFH